MTTNGLPNGKNSDMTISTFDTLVYSKKMKEVGFTEQQAEAQSEAISEIVDKLATKKDLSEMEARLMDKLTIRLGGMIMAAVTIIIGSIGALGFFIKIGH